MARYSAPKHAGTPPCGGTSLRKAAAAVLSTGLLLTAVPTAASASDRSDAARDRFLVVLQDSATAQKVADDHSHRHDANVRFVFQHALKGYAAELPQGAVDAIERDPRVAFVERDQAVRATSQTTPSGVVRSFAPGNPTLDIDGTDDVRIDADVAILDTGIEDGHPDLDVVSTTDCTASSSLGFCVEATGTDDNGHGTHVAGTVAAIDNGYGVVGVAPGARLHSLKVLSATGDGLLSWAIAAIDRVTALADTIEVANMSLGCECVSQTLDRALTRSVERGVVYIVAAGNSDKDASAFTPANHPDVVTVSALADFDGAPGGQAAASCRSDVDDTLAEFSNWGPVVELTAPGVCILSTSLGGGYRSLSGTSMASPHVAGAAAILTSGANDPKNAADVASVRHLLVSSGNFGWTDDSADGGHEPLLDIGSSDIFHANSPQRTLSSSPPTEEEDQPPFASFVYSCEGPTCHFDGRRSSDPDGTIATYEWDFGDGTVASGATVTKTFGSAGTYQVQLTVIDDAGQASRSTQQISIDDEPPPPNKSGDFTLSTTAVRAGGTTTVTLDWIGTDRAGGVIVYRNGQVLAITEDDGNHADIIRGSSESLVYKICEEGTTRCSNEARVF